jgi:outer membrane lipoprotein-sorting protein
MAGSVKAEQAPQPMMTLAIAEPILSDLFSNSADEQALTQLTAKLSLGQDIRGEFTQLRHLSVLKRPLSSQGRFIFSAVQGLVWQQTSPFSSTMILKDNQLIQIDSRGKSKVLETQKQQNPLAQQLPELLQAIMSANVAALEQKFELYLKRTNELWYLGLKPRDALIQNALGTLVLSGDTQLRSLLMLTAADAQDQQGDSVSGDFTEIQFIDTVQGPLTATELAQFQPKSVTQP